MEKFSRLTNLIGENNLQKLNNSKVIVFGVGGVGGYAVEALTRSGVGEITVVDFDTISSSNINRQIIATVQTVGKLKVEVIKERMLSINPKIKVNALATKVDSITIENIDFSSYNFVVDAIDMVSSKLLIIEKAKQNNVPIISCMGTGNKLDATKLQIADISKTEYCPLAKIMRKELKNRKITQIPVVFSKETPIKPNNSNTENKPIPSSVVYVPAVAGMLIAQYVITKILEN